MEDNLLRVFSVLISVLVLFLMPLYITFEKLDDISYSLALKITTNFVDNVNAKGYLTEEMYNDFLRELSVTSNSYDIKMEHIAKKYNPVYVIYDGSGKVIDTLDYAIYAKQVNDINKTKISVTGSGYYIIRDTAGGELKSDVIKLSYAATDIKYTDKQIKDIVFDSTDTVPYSQMKIYDYKNNVSKTQAYSKSVISSIPYMYGNYKISDDGTTRVLDNDNRMYTMNKGDQFSVRLKNENVTIATVLFNAFTLGIGGTENNTRIYINYGGTVAEEEYKENSNIPFVLGDVDMNGVVGSSDRMKLNRDIINNSVDSYSVAEFNRADVDKNGVVNGDDRDLISKYVNGDITDF